MRILTIVSGVILILTGLWCFVNQGVAFAGLAFVLGIVMVLNGLIGIAAFLKKKNRLEKMSWILSESILGVILGGIVLSNQLATDLIVIMFFGMWLLFSGCSRTVGALTMKKEEEQTWIWTMGLGIIGVVAGMFFFTNTVFGGLSAGALVGISFLIQGANMLAMGIYMPHVKRRRHYRRTRDERIEAEA